MISAGLSTKAVPASERLIVALDIPDHAQALSFVQRVGDAVQFYKLAASQVLTGDYRQLATRLVDMGRQIFVDLKWLDVPETVRAIVEQLRGFGRGFATVHASGSAAMLEAAAAAKHDFKLLAVTVLTSMDQRDHEEQGLPGTIEERVLLLARRALNHGCDGLIASGLELPRLRQALGDQPYIVVPGIRPSGYAQQDDQRRVVTPEGAFQAGADYIVVGRPIRGAEDPRAAALAIQASIARVFG